MLAYIYTYMLPYVHTCKHIFIYADRYAYMLAYGGGKRGGEGPSDSQARFAAETLGREEGGIRSSHKVHSPPEGDGREV